MIRKAHRAGLGNVNAKQTGEAIDAIGFNPFAATRTTGGSFIPRRRHVMLGVDESLLSFGQIQTSKDIVRVYPGEVNGWNPAIQWNSPGATNTRMLMGDNNIGGLPPNNNVVWKGSTAATNSVSAQTDVTLTGATCYIYAVIAGGVSFTTTISASTVNRPFVVWSDNPNPPYQSNGTIYIKLSTWQGTNGSYRMTRRNHKGGDIILGTINDVTDTV